MGACLWGEGMSGPKPQPCPVCGHSALWHLDADQGDNQYSCPWCLLDGPNTDTPAEAIAAWNRLAYLHECDLGSYYGTMRGGAGIRLYEMPEDWRETVREAAAVCREACIGKHDGLKQYYSELCQRLRALLGEGGE